MSGWLNIGSLMLGLIAWILPILNLTFYKRQDHHNWVAYIILSISACAMSLCFQLFYSYHLVKIADWSALMDTIGAVVQVAAVLVIVTIILNIITLIVYRDRVIK